jgi:hypothetical protein
VADETDGTVADVVHVVVKTVEGIGAGRPLLAIRRVVKGADVQGRIIADGEGTVGTGEAVDALTGVLGDLVGARVAVVAVVAHGAVLAGSGDAHIQSWYGSSGALAVLAHVVGRAETDVVGAVHGQAGGAVQAGEAVAGVGVDSDHNLAVDADVGVGAGAGVRRARALDDTAHAAILARVVVARVADGDFTVETAEAAAALTGIGVAVVGQDGTLGTVKTGVGITSVTLDFASFASEAARAGAGVLRASVDVVGVDDRIANSTILAVVVGAGRNGDVAELPGKAGWTLAGVLNTIISAADTDRAIGTLVVLTTIDIPFAELSSEAGRALALVLGAGAREGCAGRSVLAGVAVARIPR